MKRILLLLPMIGFLSCARLTTKQFLSAWSDAPIPPEKSELTLYERCEDNWQRYGTIEQCISEKREEDDSVERRYLAEKAASDQRKAVRASKPAGTFGYMNQNKRRRVKCNTTYTQPSYGGSPRASTECEEE